MVYKSVIFDLDQTLRGETLFTDAEFVIKELAKNKINMAIASFNKYADWFCNRYDITKYFDIICGYHCNEGKVKHINEIKSFYKNKGISFNDDEIIFFDDDISNIKDIQKNTSITCIDVNPDTGISKDVIYLIFPIIS